MDHVAIDIGGRNSQFCVRGPQGQILREAKVRTRDLPKFLKAMAPSRVVFETCAECHWLADGAKAAGHDVRVVPSTLVPALGVGSRRTKNDRKDARVLSEASCRIDLPSIHLFSKQARERKSLLSVREVLVKNRTAAINAVRGWMRGDALHVRIASPETFPERVRAVVEELPPYIDTMLKAIAELSVRILELDRLVESAAKRDETCPRLMSVPGVGPVTALAFTSTLDTIDRFADAHRVQAYLGITPGEYASSDKHHRTGITKAGPPRMRWLLVQAAWSMKRTAPHDPLVLWAKGVEQRRGKKVAIVALARRIAGVLFAIWRDGTLYSPLENRAEVTEAAE